MPNYRNEKARKAGLTISTCHTMLNDLISDIAFYDLRASDPQILFETLNEITPPEGVKYSDLDIEVLMLEMIFDTRFQLYFANMQWKMEQQVA